MKSDVIRDLVYGFETRYKEGFTKSEIRLIVSKFPDINMEKLNNAFFGNTCMVIDDNIITYHCDLLTALRCGLQHRDMLPHEWD